MKSKKILGAHCVVAALFVGGCAHYKEESGRKTEYNSDTGRFETGDYASAGFSSASPQKSQPVSEKSLKKAEAK